MAHTIRVDPDTPDPSAIVEAAEIIRAGGLVAFPTETVYGLGANALDTSAVARIYLAKGRPGYNPLIVHVPDVEAARAVASNWPVEATNLAAAFWPGPLTLVLPKHSAIPDSVTAGLQTVGVRIPAHPVALALLRAARCPIAAPSANLFTTLSPTAAEHVSSVLAEQVDLVLDAGPASVGIESTVLDLTTQIPTILRPGIISAPQLARIVGQVRAGAAETRGDEARPSPGMLDRHYAPRAELLIVESAQLRAEVEARSAGGTAVAVITHSRGDLPIGPTVACLPAEPRAYARLLYATLHAFDQAGVAVALVERVPEGSEWDGVRDRLTRAAHRQV